MEPEATLMEQSDALLHCFLDLGEGKVLTVHVVGQSCKPEDALHHAVTVETALLRIMMCSSLLMLRKKSV